VPFNFYWLAEQLDDEEFDPWEIFPSLYGSYDSDFDQLALDVLIDVRDGAHNRTDLAAYMFREMLCTAGLCDYGSSPRVCYPIPEFVLHLPKLIEHWQRYALTQWALAPDTTAADAAPDERPAR
jgi:hypothetical protein